MKLGSLAAGRPAYYDRNAFARTDEYTATVGPHGITQRFTYTIPSGKKGILEYGYSYIQRVTAPGVAGLYLAHVQCVSSGIQLRVPFVENNSAVYGLGIQALLPLSLTVYAGETIGGQTADFSTGGTVQYFLQAKSTIYDA